MAIRKLKQIEERDPYAAMVLAEFDKIEKSAALENNATSQHGKVLNLSLLINPTERRPSCKRKPESI